MTVAGASEVPRAATIEALEGVVERITYANPETGYTVARLRPSRGGGLVAVVGRLPHLNPGEAVRLAGTWSDHPRYGRQFAVTSCQQALPATAEGIRRYLGSGLIAGVGPVTAGRIVAQFGLDTLGIIEHFPQRLTRVPGLGAVRAASIARAWHEQKEAREVLIFLQGLGVAANLALRLYRKYGGATVEAVRRNPYLLARELPGVAFATADGIAQRLGLDSRAEQRAGAALHWALLEAADNGHVCLPRGEAVAAAARLTSASEEWVEAALPAVEQEGLVARALLGVGDTLYLPHLLECEREVAKQLRELAPRPGGELFSSAAEAATALSAAERQLGFALSTRQREAIQEAVSHPFTILTGGPGTGKTTCLRVLARMLRYRNLEVVLAAPTGRAAKRLADLTGRPARTVHRLLGLRPGSEDGEFTGNHITADVVIVDEASMIDLPLLRALLAALGPRGHLVLVGDVDQLPPVGPGAPLRDAIQAGGFPVVRLDEVFRQARASYIIVNAHRINAGQMPRLQDCPDFFFLPAENAEQAAARIVTLVSEAIPARFGFDPLRDIQVLSPMHRGPAGVARLNQRLQEVLNPARPGRQERAADTRVWREGDRVIQVQNNYDRQCFNGDLGQIARIDPLDRRLLVAFEDGRGATYGFDELDEIAHAYAMTVHKSQGGEYPAVVMPLLTEHYVMLWRNLLYTAVTRARELVVLVGSRQALAIATRRAEGVERYGGLRERLALPSGQA